MNKQDFIDLVNSAIDKLEKQGEPCKNEYNHCVYLNDNQFKVMELLKNEYDTDFDYGFSGKIKAMREIIAEYEAENDK